MTPYRERYIQGPGRLTQAVRILLVANLVVFLAQVLLDLLTKGKFTVLFGLSRGMVLKGCVWQIATYMFLHDTHNIWHLLLNMWILYFMGPDTERAMGTRHFTVMYLLSGMLGGLGWIIIERYHTCIGASGAIFGVLGAFAVLYPNGLISLLFPPVTLKAWVFVLLLAGIEFAMLVGAQGSSVAHSVHLAGVVVGSIYAWVIFKGGGAPLGEWTDRAPLRFRMPRRKPRGDGVSQAELDRVLDKVAEQGINSLNGRERKLLQRASREKRRS